VHVDTYRETMTQPYVYWTLECPFATIIGLYSNVDGSLDGRGTNEQQRWLEGQLTAAPTDKCLILAVHHPPYSLDADHGGSPAIVAALERAAKVSGRWPDAVFSGHVHNYQRFTRTIGDSQIPFLVAGAGGYANDPKSMHQLQLDHNGNALSGEYFLVPFDDAPPTSPVDTFRLNWRSHRLESEGNRGTPENHTRRRRR
jgi:3',5'-cyclic AMP phosphodiesterase CpdA